MEGLISIVNLQVADGRIEYTVDMEKDWIKQIHFVDRNGELVGEIYFKYLSTNDMSDKAFNIPKRPSGNGYHKTQQLHWLAELAANKL